MPVLGGYIPETSRKLVPRTTNKSPEMPKCVAPEQELTLAEEIAKLREQVEELVYWIKPMNGNLVTGKAAVEEYRRLIK